MSENQQEAIARYEAACHAVRTGIMLLMGSPKYKAAEPKDLRLGIDSAQVSQAAIVELLVRKGIITYDEWYSTLADAMEKEKAEYTQEVGKKVGPGIVLK